MLPSAPVGPVPQEGETPSIPETPHFDPDQGDPSPDDLAIGVATKIESKEGMTQTPPLVSRLIQGYLEHTGIDACPLHRIMVSEIQIVIIANGPLAHSI